MNVVQVLPALNSGGVERGTLEVARHLVAHGHRSFVISAGGRLVNDLVTNGSEHIDWDIGRKSPLTLRYIIPLRNWLQTQKIDILHVRSRFPAWICYLAWKGMDPKTRPKFITTVHGPYSVNAYSAVMTKGERIIVISEMIRDYVLKNYAVNAERLQLNYRGVDPRDYHYGYQPTLNWRDNWYQQFPETKGKRLICLPARLTRWKGQRDFIELLSALKLRHPDVHGLVVGEAQKGKQQFLDELKFFAEQKGVSNHITFTGHRSDVREIMSISEFVLSLSTAPEAFGRTTIEALSLGVPVIAYAHGGVDEQLTAILPEGKIKNGDITSAIELASKWLEQPPVIPKEHPFTLGAMLSTTLSVYQDCLIQSNSTPTRA